MSFLQLLEAEVERPQPRQFDSTDDEVHELDPKALAAVLASPVELSRPPPPRSRSGSVETLIQP